MVVQTSGLKKTTGLKKPLVLLVACFNVHVLNEIKLDFGVKIFTFFNCDSNESFAALYDPS